MRSVFIILQEDNVELIKTHLSLYSNNHNDNLWIIGSTINPVLFIRIDISKLLLDEIELESLDAIKNKLNSKIGTILQIDISGRHNGTEEVISLFKHMLSLFKGIAIDDYSNYPWTIQEIIECKLIDNKIFNDYQ